jgi:hypothetical protein
LFARLRARHSCCGNSCCGQPACCEPACPPSCGGAAAAQMNGPMGGPAPMGAPAPGPAPANVPTKEAPAPKPAIQ